MSEVELEILQILASSQVLPMLFLLLRSPIIKEKTCRRTNTDYLLVLALFQYVFLKEEETKEKYESREKDIVHKCKSKDLVFVE